VQNQQFWLHLNEGLRVTLKSNDGYSSDGTSSKDFIVPWTEMKWVLDPGTLDWVWESQRVLVFDTITYQESGTVHATPWFLVGAIAILLRCLHHLIPRVLVVVLGIQGPWI
jgi:hypothetical protein